MAVILGGGGVPFDKIGTFNPALMVHGTEGIELYGEIPPEGELESEGVITGIWDKGKAAVAEIESIGDARLDGQAALQGQDVDVLPRRR